MTDYLQVVSKYRKTILFVSKQFFLSYSPFFDIQLENISLYVLTQNTYVQMRLLVNVQINTRATLAHSFYSLKIVNFK